MYIYTIIIATMFCKQQLIYLCKLCQLCQLLQNKNPKTGTTCTGMTTRSLAGHKTMWFAIKAFHCLAQQH